MKEAIAIAQHVAIGVGDHKRVGIFKGEEPKRDPRLFAAGALPSARGVRRKFVHI